MNHYTLFVGDLSIFSTEEDLHNLFTPFGDLIEAKIIRCEETKKNLSYGFVKFCSYEAAINAMSQMNGHVLGGRPLRIGWASRKNRSSDSNSVHDDNYSTGLQTPSLSGSGEYFEHLTSAGLRPEHLDRASIHIIYHSNQIDKPVTEETFRKAFSHFGCVLDATIKKFEINKEQNWQKGYGFVHFSADPCGTNTAVQAAHSMNGRCVDGVTLKCSLSHRLRSMVTNGYQSMGIEPMPGLRSNSFDGSYTGFASMSPAPIPSMFGYGASIASNTGFPLATVNYGGIAVQNVPFNHLPNPMIFHPIAPPYQVPHYSSELPGINISRAYSQDSYFPNPGIPPIYNPAMVSGRMNGMPLNFYHYQQQQYWLEMLCSQALLQQMQGQVPHSIATTDNGINSSGSPSNSTMETSEMQPITTQIKESYSSPPVTTATAATNRTYDTSTTKESATSSISENDMPVVSCDADRSTSDQQELEDSFSPCAANTTPTHLKESKIFPNLINGQHVMSYPNTYSRANAYGVEDTSDQCRDTTTIREDDADNISSANQNTSQYHNEDKIQNRNVKSQILQQNTQDYCTSMAASVETGMTTTCTKESHGGVAPEKSQSRRSSVSELSYCVGSCCSLDSFNSDEGLDEMNYLGDNETVIADNEQHQRLAQMMVPLQDNNMSHYQNSLSQSCKYNASNTTRKVDDSHCAHNMSGKQTGLPPQHPINIKMKRKTGHHDTGKLSAVSKKDQTSVDRKEHSPTDSNSSL